VLASLVIALCVLLNDATQVVAKLVVNLVVKLVVKSASEPCHGAVCAPQRRHAGSRKASSKPISKDSSKAS
jgi:hypothetical protein